eukprot:TRINITY_DN77015_c0_g1_i1.p1 TRINITY_DN77015_c0_g1~~TRINITY_DN77015_c0_g1_i1.p1  ORF type:complete len:277 (-),score=51.22 TRINITY_DN77015_c0_g1_i1:692-1495(-)
MTNIFAGGVALVTGGVSGLGAATTIKLLKNGVSVLAVDMREDTAKAFMEENAGKYPNTKLDVALADVTKEADVLKCVEKAQAMGTLRIVVNCAGIGFPGRILSSSGKPQPLGNFAKVVQVNLIGTYNVSRLGAAAMAKADPLPGGDNQRGVIINVASVAAFEGQIGQCAYSASKGGVVSMTLPMARDLAVVGIRCNTIAPGIVDTPMLRGGSKEMVQGLAADVVFPKRVAIPDEFAELAWQMCTNSYLNGTTIRLDGGIRMPPKSKM